MRKSNKKRLSLILSMMLVVVMTIGAIGCSESSEEKKTSATTSENSKKTSDDTQSKNDGKSEDNVLGEGSTVFDFTVTDADGKETSYEIHTDKDTVGDALLELKLIDGEDGDYGLYVKTVDGITVDYDKDGKYWAFYVDGDYATAGVDATKITEGSKYAFKVE